jgi:hypothetical protein
VLYQLSYGGVGVALCASGARQTEQSFWGDVGQMLHLEDVMTKDLKPILAALAACAVLASCGTVAGAATGAAVGAAVGNNTGNGDADQGAAIGAAAGAVAGTVADHD